jgi:CheY-like chemotaxis protein
LTGACVELAASSAEGLIALDTFGPQVILCDIAMPEEDGYTFMRKLRARESRRGATIPALALTGRAATDDRLRALAAGFQLHLAKPVDLDRLRDAVFELARLLEHRTVPGHEHERASGRGR